MREYKLTYTQGDRLEREHLGVIFEHAAKHVADQRRRNSTISDVKLWVRPKPWRWEPVLLERANNGR